MADTLLGNLIWKITGSTTDFDKSLTDSESKLKTFSKRAGEIGSDLTLKVTAPLAALGGVAVKAASDLSESLNAVGVVFEDSADKINSFGETASSAAGLSQTAFNEIATVIGAQLKQSGQNIDVVADSTIELTKRAADLASVFNTDVKDSAGALGAALRGESEPARRFGINLSDAAVQAEALATGLVASKNEITDQIKVQARYSLILKQSSDVAGDFVNTSDGLANSTRILQADLANTAAELGENLLPLVTNAVGFVSDLVDGFNDFDDSTKSTIVAIAGVAAAVGPLLKLFSLATGPAGLITLAVTAFGLFTINLSEGAAQAKIMQERLDAFNSSTVALSIDDLTERFLFLQEQQSLTAEETAEFQRISGLLQNAIPGLTQEILNNKTAFQELAKATQEAALAQSIADVTAQQTLLREEVEKLEKLGGRRSLLENTILTIKQAEFETVSARVVELRQELEDLAVEAGTNQTVFEKYNATLADTTENQNTAKESADATADGFRTVGDSIDLTKFQGLYDITDDGIAVVNKAVTSITAFDLGIGNVATAAFQATQNISTLNTESENLAKTAFDTALALNSSFDLGLSGIDNLTKAIFDSGVTFERTNRNEIDSEFNKWKAINEQREEAYRLDAQAQLDNLDYILALKQTEKAEQIAIEQEKQEEIDNIRNIYLAREEARAKLAVDYVEQAEADKVSTIIKSEEEIRQARAQTFGIITQGFGALGNLLDTFYTNEINAAAENSEEQQRLELERFRTFRLIKAAEATISTLSAVLEAPGGPLGPIGIATAVIGAANVAAILATKPNIPSQPATPTDTSIDTATTAAAEDNTINRTTTAAAQTGNVFVIEVDGEAIFKVMQQGIDNGQVRLTT